jgi:hypothetical protein
MTSRTALSVLLAGVAVFAACGEGPAETNFAGLYTSALLSSNRNPAAVGDTVTFTLNVIADVGTPFGFASFRRGGIGIPGCVDLTVAAAAATCRIATIPSGEHHIQASYNGNGQYLGSQTPVLVQVIN